MSKKLLLRFFPVLLILIFSSSLFAQTIQTDPKSKNPNVDYKVLAGIDSVVNDYINKDWVKGVVTLIVKDNQLVQYKGYGYADAETKKPMKPNDIFRIMSQTKAITSVAAMILYEEGKFKLDQPIADFIPEFRNPTVIASFNKTDTSFTTVPAKREITFHDLLTHTSGIGYSGIGTDTVQAIYAKVNIPSGLGHMNMTLLEGIKILAKQPLAFQPGDRWMYGLNSDVLGCLVEVISGMSLEDFMRKRIFDPLGMKDTYFNLPQDRHNRLATVYTEQPAGTIIKWDHIHYGIDPDYPMIRTDFFSGGAGLSSTAFDYAIFLQMLLNGGIYNKHRVLKPETIALMTQNQIGELSLGPNKFGLGFSITTEQGATPNGRSKGSFAWGGYFGTNYWADPKENMVVLIMTQHTPNSHGDLFRKIENIIYAAVK